MCISRFVVVVVVLFKIKKKKKLFLTSNLVRIQHLTHARMHTCKLARVCVWWCAAAKTVKTHKNRIKYGHVIFADSIKTS